MVRESLVLHTALFRGNYGATISKWDGAVQQVGEENDCCETQVGKTLERKLLCVNLKKGDPVFA